MPSRDMGKLKSFLGTQSELEGELRIKGVLRLDGAIKGKVVADQVILSETANINGEILAKKIIVGGNVEGTLKATELLEIGSKGRVQGEIIASKLVVLEGGTFNGRVEMQSAKVNVLGFEPRSRAISGSR